MYQNSFPLADVNAILDFHEMMNDVDHDEIEIVVNEIYSK